MRIELKCALALASRCMHLAGIPVVLSYITHKVNTLRVCAVARLGWWVNRLADSHLPEVELKTLLEPAANPTAIAVIRQVLEQAEKYPEAAESAERLLAAVAPDELLPPDAAFIVPAIDRPRLARKRSAHHELLVVVAQVCVTWPDQFVSASKICRELQNRGIECSDSSVRNYLSDLAKRCNMKSILEPTKRGMPNKFAPGSKALLREWVERYGDWEDHEP